MPLLADTRRTAGRKTWIEIRLDRLRTNLGMIRLAAGTETKIMAVVKANAYGHGLIETARALAPEVTYLGVSSVEEVLKLKESGISTPVFLFGCLLKEELPAVMTGGITLSAASLEDAEAISEVSQSLQRRTPVHIKVDTGMGRLGLPWQKARRQVEMIADLPGIEIEGFYTHFPTAEKEDGFAQEQIARLNSLLDELDKRHLRFKFRHAANSAGIFKIRAPHLNMARPGLMLYGLYPDESLRARVRVLPVLSLKSRIIAVKHLEAGDTVGYGRTFSAGKPTTIAILPIGYSHGYPWQAASRARVIFKGRLCPVAGRISMDYMAVDLGSQEAAAGEEVTLIGEENGAVITAEDLARWTGTIPYEIVTRLSASLPRIYR